MRVAVISDVHANPHALTNVLHQAKMQKCEHIICLGDIVGYGYDPNGCIEICKQHKIECIKGNHDAGLIGELSLDWFNETARRQVLAHRPLVTEENKEWVRRLPLFIEKDYGGIKYAFSHGTYLFPERFEYIDGAFSAATEMDVIRNNCIDALFVGHTHEACAYYRDESISGNVHCLWMHNEKSFKSMIKTHDWSEAVFNPGSIGYPRRQEFCYYIILDTETGIVEWRRLPMCLTEYRDRLLSAGMQVPIWVESRIYESSNKED